MDTRTGEITHFANAETFEKLQKALRDDEDKIKHMVPVDNAKPGQLRAKKVGRNGPCPCGSGKKFKKCCMGRAASAQERRDIAEEIRAASD